MVATYPSAQARAWDAFMRLEKRRGPNQSGWYSACCPVLAHGDRHASLGFSLTPDGAIAFKCQAGCEKHDIVAALGYTLADTFAPKPQAERPIRLVTPDVQQQGQAKRLPPVVTRYELHFANGLLAGVHGRRDYLDAEGKPYRKKDVWWERHKGCGAEAMPLYRLGKLLAARTDAPVYVCEGEKATDALARAGVLAVGTVTGAGGTPCDDALRPLVDHDVTLWPDNDDVGRAHMQLIAERLVALGQPRKRLHWLAWPDAPAKGDAADYLATGGTVEGLAELIGAPPGATTGEASPSDYSDDDHPVEDTWDDPTPLPTDLVAVNLLDKDMLPDCLRAWIFDMAERMSVAPDFFAAPALVVACSLVGRRIGIHPKRYDDWLVVPNTFGGIVAPPGFLKTAALEQVMKPLDRLAHEEADRFRERNAYHEATQMASRARKKAIEDAMTLAAKKSDHTRLAELTTEAASLVVEEETQRRYKLNDGTVEKIGQLLAENTQGLLVFRDELSGWLRTLDKQGHDNDRAFYLEAHTGTGAFDVERVGRGSLHIPALCLSILGGIQPGPLASYVHDANSNGAANDGLIQRFQLLIWPDLPRTYTHVDRWPDTQAKNRAFAALRAVAALAPETVGAMSDDPTDPDAIPALRFHAAAQALFDEWYIRLQNRLRSSELSAPIAAHLSKYASLMPSLALVFHLIDGIDDLTAASGGVSEDAAARAIAWCEYLESHAQRLYASATAPEMEKARILLSHIKRGEVADGCRIRDVYNAHHWEHLTTHDDVEAAANVLEDFGWVRIETLKGDVGRPSKTLRIHPRYRPAKSQTP